MPVPSQIPYMMRHHHLHIKKRSSILTRNPSTAICPELPKPFIQFQSCATRTTPSHSKPIHYTSFLLHTPISYLPCTTLNTPRNPNSFYSPHLPPLSFTSSPLTKIPTTRSHTILYTSLPRRVAIKSRCSLYNRVSHCKFRYVYTAAFA